jgi:diguanylate cyclase (GGDEF)-like protein
MNDPSSPLLRVLLLDDDEKILRMLKIFLQQQGYVVHIAGNGQEGLRRLVSEAYDLVIVDVQMPVLDGLGFARAARKLQPWLDLMFCTGAVDNQLKRSASELGIQQILKKPISFNTLESCIKQLQKKNPVHPPNPAQFRRSLPPLRTWFDQILQAPHLDRLVQVTAATPEKLFPNLGTCVMLRDQDYTLCRLQSQFPLSEESQNWIRETIDQQLKLLGEEPGCLDAPCQVHIDQPDAEYLHLKQQACILAPMTSLAGVDGFIACVLESPEAAAEQQVQLMQLAHHVELGLQTIRTLRDVPAQDPLTGVMNRCGLDQKMEQLWQHRNLPNVAPGALILDLKDLHAINQRYGTKVGSRVLQELAQALAALKQPGMQVGRFEADQFLILVDQTDPSALRQLLEQVEAQLKSTSVTLGEITLHPDCLLRSVMLSDLTEAQSGLEWIEAIQNTLYAAKRMEMNPEAHGQDSGEAEPPPYDPHEVLVVDDDPQVFHLIRRMLNSKLYNLTYAPNVNEGIQLLQEGKRFELLLTDLILPDLDGSDMMRLAAKEDPDMIMVVVSGNISSESDKKLRGDGAFDVIRKPFDLATLRGVVAKAVEARGRSLRKEQKHRQS